MSQTTGHSVQHSDADHGSSHVVPKSIYFAVFGALIFLTWVTAGVATLDLGRFNIVVALSIAILKASLVLFFFMHVKYGTKLTKMVILCGFYWLLLLLGIVLIDIWTRTWMGVPGR